MKKVFLLGIICTLFIGGFEKTYSMSSKRMPEKKKEIEIIEPVENVSDTIKPKDYIVEPLKQPDIIINNENINGLYKELSKVEGEKTVRRYPSEYKGNYYEVYTGEELIIEGQEIIGARLIKFPYMSENEISIVEDTVHFETYYQGEYQVEVEGILGNIRVLDIKVKHKYNFTEKANYDIILNSYNDKDYEVFSAAKELFVLSYPNSFTLKEVFFMDIKVEIELGRFVEAKKVIEDTRNIYKLTEDEKNTLLLLEEETYEEGSDNHINFLYENKEVASLRKELIQSFEIGDDLDTRDVELLRDEYKKNPSAKTSQLLGNHYLKIKSNGEAIKYLTYANDYEKIANIYLDEREFNLFDSTLDKISEAKKPALLNKKSRIKETMVVERELNLGRSRFKSENYQEAILFFDRAKRRDAKIAEELGVNLDLGLSYYNLFDYKDAITHLEKIRKTGNEYEILEANYYIAMSYYRYYSEQDLEETSENINQPVVDYSKKSLEYFDKIVKDYPETSWAKKSMIYIMRLRKE